MFVFTGSAVLVLLVSFVVAEVRDVARGRAKRETRPRTRTGRWRYEAALTK
jgi:hypothetical protein